MAKEPQSDDAPRKKRKGASIVVWSLLGLLIVGLSGFGVSNFGGNITAIGKVGDREIDVNDYARGLQQELARLEEQFGQAVPFQTAQSFGVDRQVLQGLLTRTALDGEADRIGISAGDGRVAAKISADKAFFGTAGTFDPEAYSFVLDRNNLTKQKYETGLREDQGREILSGAIAGGFVAPASVTETIYAYIGERRGFTLLQLTEADLTAPLPVPTEADLTAFHTANIAQFTKPEAKRITTVALLPETVVATLPPADEAAVRALYDERIAEFVQPERRLVERLVFATDADATAAKARIDAGEAFETLVTERGLALEDIDLGDVAIKDLGPAGDAVFALTEPGVVGPFLSDLGPALFRMNAILAAQETTFDTAKADLTEEYQMDTARKTIDARVEEIDDLLAGGATLEDLAKEPGMVLSQIDYVPGAADNGPVAAYAAVQAAAEKLAIGDFPEAIAVDDGGLVALRLDEIVPPTPIPFADAKADVEAAFRADALTKALAARAIEVKSAVEGGARLGSFGIVTVTPQIARDGTVAGATADLVAGLFTMAAGDVRVFEGPGFTGVAQLDTITPAAATGDGPSALRAAITAQVEQGIAQDAFTLFTDTLTTKAGITLDQSAINAVHANFN